MTSEEKRIEQAALEYAKKHRTEIARRLTDPAIFVPEADPVSRILPEFVRSLS